MVSGISRTPFTVSLLRAGVLLSRTTHFPKEALDQRLRTETETETIYKQTNHCLDWYGTTLVTAFISVREEEPLAAVWAR
ncbi:hypothetical protein INR49_007466 [Caranx melampygus]|nr:hypothetical protein INR49_007466 [Caranx melampygus]